MSNLLWGQSTWFLFHTLAEKVKDEEFSTIKLELIGCIKNISSNLPCPSCREHATKLLAIQNYDQIKTKDDFKKFIFDFHNVVNKNSNKKIESIEILDKYKLANLINIVNYWNQCFTASGVNRTLLMDSFSRSRLKENINLFFKNNLHRFNN